MGSPRYACAPMVLQSELAFRNLVRRHGCTLCYAPMLPAAAFLASPADGDREQHPDTGGPATQAAWFSTSRHDSPLIAQLGGSDADELVAAALLIQDRCDAVDLNIGCPQRCAALGHYGAFLLDDPERVRAIVLRLVEALSIPVTAKMRILPEIADTIAFAIMLEEAGVSAVVVHGRWREQRHHEGPASWEAIAAVKAALRIPVIANGNVRTKADADACLAATGADAVMSATGLLSNPRLFSDAHHATTTPDGGAAATTTSGAAYVGTAHTMSSGTRQAVESGSASVSAGVSGSAGRRVGQGPAVSGVESASVSVGVGGSAGRRVGQGPAESGVESGSGSVSVGVGGSAGGRLDLCSRLANASAPRRFRHGRPTPLGRIELSLEFLLCAEESPHGCLPRMISDHVLAILRPVRVHTRMHA